VESKNGLSISAFAIAATIVCWTGMSHASTAVFVWGAFRGVTTSGVRSGGRGLRDRTTRRPSS
jgi:hypothetical protein